MVTTTPLNSSHILFNDIPLNKTALDFYNYTLYGNGTVSNDSRCWLVFKPYVPTMLPNGTFLNADKCDSPIQDIKTRGILGIVFAVLFGFELVFLMSALTKHGKSYLPPEKNYRPVSRRWPFYWAIITVVCGLISCIMAIDIDRFWIQGAPVMLSAIFFYIMSSAVLGCIWETTRNWIQFQERKVLIMDPFYFPPDDLRSKIEFYQPMVIYLWIFLGFFLSVLRKWEPIRRQFFWVYRDPRFNASSAFNIIALISISLAFMISFKFYRQSNPPAKIPAMIIFALVQNGYLIASTVEKKVTILFADTNSGWIYGLGYTPILIVVLILLLSAYFEDNEDLVIKRMRMQSDRLLEMGMIADAKKRKKEQERNKDGKDDDKVYVEANRVDSDMSGPSSNGTLV